MKNKFQKMVVSWAILIALIPLVFSYGIFLYDKLNSMQTSINKNLYEVAFYIKNTPFIQQKLYKRENDYSIQKYVMKFVNSLDSADIIVVADMTGEKYSHLDETQIGQIFVNKDKKVVLEKGIGYYSLMQGSMGITYRRFEPIFYKNKQVGFVMVGKYYKDIKIMNKKAEIMYILLFIFVISLTVISSINFSRKVKKKILNMEPEEIAKLYNEKNIIINSISDGIIGLDKDDNVVQINKNCYNLFENFSMSKINNKLKPYINKHEPIDMREMIILKKRIFVNFNPIFENGKYLGAVITLIDKKEINEIAREITGIDEIVKTLRANVHEFKNKLHVILGLIQIKEYDEAKKYILQSQENQQNNSMKFKSIEDYYVRGMLISREIVAREKNIKFSIDESSLFYQNHGYVSSNDIIIIMGNLIENAFEACTFKESKEKKVEVSLSETENQIYMEVKDNGVPIPKDIRETMFKRGISSKGENRGIGLYLIKKKVELYNGIIEIDEDEEQKKIKITLSKGEF